jgi:hypothetical protein
VNSSLDLRTRGAERETAQADVGDSRFEKSRALKLGDAISSPSRMAFKVLVGGEWDWIGLEPRSYLLIG